MIDGGLRKEFMKHLCEMHWSPIESGATIAGLPDANYCSIGQEGWVEFKKTEGWAIKFRIGQTSWHERRARAGGRSFIAVRRTNMTIRTGKTDMLFLYRGTMARALETEGLQPHLDHALVRCEGPPARWDWERVRAVLQGGL